MQQRLLVDKDDHLISEKIALLLLLSFSSAFYSSIILHIDVFYPPGGPRGAVPSSCSSRDDRHI